MATELTWLGHSSFRFDSPGGKRVYIDPFLNGNPSCPEGEVEPERCDLIALSHGHDDHLGDTLAIAEKFECPVIAQVELRGYLATRGLPQDATQAVNKGGTIEVQGMKLTMTHGNHSSSVFSDGVFLYAGESCGFVFEVEDGLKIYYAGDTNVFGDMSLIGRIYSPDVAIIPIGDHFTMGPEEAAIAAELVGAPRVIPSHYGTFPILSGTPDALRALLPDGVELLAPQPGEPVAL
jgi:L-ascorbate metabolism protein UlaG (beta-lactamase superfamily)